MEGKDWVLVCKDNEHLYLALIFRKVGRSKGAGRPVWEWTEDFMQCNGFPNLAAIDAAVRKHKIPAVGVKVRPYENAHLTWTQNLNKQDHDRS